MSEHLPSTPQAIYDELTMFTFERDSAFRQHDTSGTEIVRTSNNHVDTLYSDDGGDRYDIENSKRLELIARYNLIGKERPRSNSKILFNLKLTTVTQVSVLPPVLSAYFSDEQRQYYDTIEPGDLNETRYLEYIVKHTIEDKLMVARHMEYELCDNDTPLYLVHDPVSKNSFERVAVAQEQRTIVVPPRITQEQNNDIGSQIECDALLRSMREASERPDFTKEEYEADAIFSIRALLKILRTSDPLPMTDDVRLRKKFLKSPPDKNNAISDSYPYLF